LQNNEVLLDEAKNLYEVGKTAEGMFAEDPSVQTKKVPLSVPSSELQSQLDSLL